MVSFQFLFVLDDKFFIIKLKLNFNFNQIFCQNSKRSMESHPGEAQKITLFMILKTTSVGNSECVKFQ